MKQGRRYIVRPRPDLIENVVHIFTDQTHEVEVYATNAKDPTKVFLHCLTHGHSNWVTTDQIINETPEESETTDMQSFKLFFANFNHKTDTEVHMDHFATRETEAESAMDLINRYTEVKSAYVIIKNLTDNTLLVWDRIDNCPREVTKKLLVTKKVFKVAFTGHRPDKLTSNRRAYNLNHPIRVWIRQQIKAQLLTLKAIYPDLEVIVGGALGVDTDAAIVAMELCIPHHFYAPCHEQFKVWPQESKDMWLVHWNAAKTSRYIHEGPYYGPNCMQKRNEAMVDDANLLISVWNGSAGGTNNCIQYARTKGKEIINFNPNDANLSGIPKVSKTTQPEPTKKEAIAYFDGACQGNPGPATAGILITDRDENIIVEHGFRISNSTTNNVAEWQACLHALRTAKQFGITHLELRGDSELVIKQMRGEYQVKDAKLIPLHDEALDLCTYFRACVFVHVPREDNPADATANSAF